jgi:PAS domain S-box-containing protein
LEAFLIKAINNGKSVGEGIQLTDGDRARRELASRSDWSEMDELEHFVQFYEADEFLLNSLCGFIGAGLGIGEACIVIATKAHREGLEERLQACGVEVTVAKACGQYVSLDAAEILSEFMVDGAPEPERFAEVIGSIIAPAAEGRRRVRIFGEMVTLLWADGNYNAVVRLEELWDDLRQTYAFSLFCAYPMSGFSREELAEPLARVFAAHSRVIPAESYSALTNPDDRLRTITLLQQQAQSLQTEKAEWRKADERLRISEIRYRRLFEEAKDGILMVDPETHKIIDANPSIAALFGSTPQELLGKELWEIGLLKDPEASREAFQQLQEKHLVRYEHLLLQTGDGQSREVEFVSNLYQTNGHQVIQCNVRDITERKRAEEVNAHLAAIVERRSLRNRP